MEDGAVEARQESHSGAKGILLDVTMKLPTPYNAQSRSPTVRARARAADREARRKIMEPLTKEKKVALKI
eukprot:608152-Amorphochlora_amoeboformis.AAC.1